MTEEVLSTGVAYDMYEWAIDDAYNTVPARH